MKTIFFSKYDHETRTWSEPESEAFSHTWAQNDDVAGWISHIAVGSEIKIDFAPSIHLMGDDDPTGRPGAINPYVASFKDPCVAPEISSYITCAWWAEEVSNPAALPWWGDLDPEEQAEILASYTPA